MDIMTKTQQSHQKICALMKSMILWTVMMSSASQWWCRTWLGRSQTESWTFLHLHTPFHFVQRILAQLSALVWQTLVMFISLTVLVPTWKSMSNPENRTHNWIVLGWAGFRTQRILSLLSVWRINEAYVEILLVFVLIAARFELYWFFKEYCSPYYY